MNRIVKIKTVWTIPKNINKLFIYFLLFYSIFTEFLVSVVGFPSAMRYLNDLIVIVLFVCCCGSIISKFRKLKWQKVLVLMAVYIISLIVGLCINGGDVLLVLWATRNTFRFFAFFIACIVFLEREDVLWILESLQRLQWLNLVLCLFEYFVLGAQQDNLGGMFGTAKGCNGALNVYLCVVMIYVICKYQDKKCSVRQVIFTLLSSLVIAAMAELKVVYIEIIAITAVALFLGTYRRKILPVLLSLSAGVVVGLALLQELFPEHYEVLTDFDNIMEYISSSGGGYNLSRFHAFENIDALFFQGDIWKNLFGLGFGNCEYSGFSFLTSDFYLRYGQYNYRWFAHQMMFLETGYVGLILYISVLVGIMVCAYRTMRSNEQFRFVSEFVVILALLSIACLWYNSVIRAEPAYLTFFALSAAAVCQKDGNRSLSPEERKEIG